MIRITPPSAPPSPPPSRPLGIRAPGALALVTLASVALAACSFAPESVEFVENTCSSHDDCPGARCDEELGMCVSDAAEQILIGLEVTPATDPSGATPATVAFEPFAVEGPETRELLLPAPISVVGNIRWGEVSVPAEITFELPSHFPGGAPIRVVASTASEPMLVADGNLADYSVRLVADRTYRVKVEPKGEGAHMLPPLRFEGPVPGGGDVWRLDLSYPPATEIIELRGRVVDGSGPVEGLQIRAVEVGTSQVVSSVAVTDPVTGEFMLRIDPYAGPYVLRVSGSSESVFPTFTVDPSYLFPEDGVIEVLVPDLAGEAVEYTGVVETAAGEPIPEAIVTFKSQDVFDDTTGVVGSFRTTATTDAEGYFTVNVLPGTYEVLVTPTAREVAMSVMTVRVDMTPTREICCQLFPIPERATYGGKIFTHDMREMAGATVQAIALGWPGETLSPAARFNRSTDAVSDPTGQFELRLDEGTYDLLVKPPAESGFPWIVRRELVIGASSRPIHDVFELAAPVPVDGRVQSSQGTPLVSAEIKAYAIIETHGMPRAIQIGRAITDADGRYRLLLPPSF